MKNLLDKARGKSEKERKAIAFSISSIFVFLIFILWGTTLPGRISEDINKDSLTESIKESSKASVIDSLKRNMELIKSAPNPFEGTSLEGLLEDEIEYTQTASSSEVLFEEQSTTTSTSTIDELDPLLEQFNRDVEQSGAIRPKEIDESIGAVQ